MRDRPLFWRNDSFPRVSFCDRGDEVVIGCNVFALVDVDGVFSAESLISFEII